MKATIKRYLPFTIIIFFVYLIVPTMFISGAMARYSTVAYYFIFPATAIVCSAVYCSKYGMDFFFSLIAPVIYIPSMLIFNGGFSFTNIILLVSYLIAGIFGLFIGDIAFGDARHQREKLAEEEAEQMLLNAKRRDEQARREILERDFVDVKSSAIKNRNIDKNISETEIDEILSEIKENN